MFRYTNVETMVTSKTNLNDFANIFYSYFIDLDLMRANTTSETNATGTGAARSCIYSWRRFDVDGHDAPNRGAG